jgi:sulfur carrier protein ThiS
LAWRRSTKILHPKGTWRKPYLDHGKVRFVGSTQESGEVQLTPPVNGVMNLEEIAKELNKKIGFKLLDKGLLKKGNVRVLHEGTPLTAKDWKEKRVKAGDQVSIVVPLMGG